MHYEIDIVDVIQDMKHTVSEIRRDLILLSAIQSVLEGNIEPDLIHLSKEDAIAHFLSLYQSGIENNASECDCHLKRIENWLKDAIAPVATVPEAT
jgi:hypothetical protein